MNPSNENCCASDGNSCSPSPSVFANKVELEAAVNEWVSDATAAEAVHGPLPEWDVSFVLDLDGLFKSKGDFNGDISKWDTSKVTSMHSTFQRTAFNQPLVWDTSQVTNMGYEYGVHVLQGRRFRPGARLGHDPSDRFL